MTNMADDLMLQKFKKAIMGLSTLSVTPQMVNYMLQEARTELSSSGRLAGSRTVFGGEKDGENKAMKMK
jgi:hypothetical protein